MEDSTAPVAKLTLESMSGDPARPASQGPAARRAVTEHPAHRPARLTLYAGVVLLALGAIVLYLGYNGAATNALLQAQMPYIVSGGFAGLALVILGGIALAVYALLQVQADFRAELRDTRATLEELSEALGRSAPARSNGALEAGIVVTARGSDSFHRPECRLVERAAGRTRTAQREEADRAGLVPCRICKP